MSQPPSTVFKYNAFSTRSLLLLKRQSLYFGSQREFNDPYDCAINATIESPQENVLEDIRNMYVTSSETPEDARQRFAEMCNRELRVVLLRAAHVALAQEREEFLDRKGVTCFSERNDDLRMWAHYGDRYRGFCLEFRTSVKPFEKLRRVNYVKDMPSLTLHQILVEKEFDSILTALYCTKSMAWAHEKEWRAIHQTVGTVYTYDAEALKAVYFGPDIDEAALEIICLIIQGQNPDVEFWRGELSSETFGVSFTEFPYIPFVKAREMGLR